jgi:hypothetical protein
VYFSFVYESSDQPIIFTNWLVGQPSGLHFGKKENCVHMGLAGTSEWNDRGCDTFKEKFICEGTSAY